MTVLEGCRTVIIDYTLYLRECTVVYFSSLTIEQSISNELNLCYQTPAWLLMAYRYHGKLATAFNNIVVDKKRV